MNRTMMLLFVCGLAVSAQQTIQIVPPLGNPLSAGIKLVAPELKVAAVCSVPLLEANVSASDPGIAAMPGNSVVAMPQANLPAPACESQGANQQTTFMIDDQAAKELEQQLASPTFKLSPPASQNGVCSVQPARARSDTNDPGIAANPQNKAVPLPKANVPAPPCPKQ